MKLSSRRLSATATLAWIAPLALTIGLAACSGQGSTTLPAGGANALSAPISDPEVSGGAVAPVAAPNAAPAPIQLVIGTTVGTPTFPEGDTATGGHGQPVDTFKCLLHVGGPGHHHVHVSLFVNGQQLAIPLGIGMLHPDHGPFIYHQTCLYFLHTHDSTGIIHMEPKVGNGSFTLGNVFDLWGEPLTTSNIAGYTGQQTIVVDGNSYTGDPSKIVLAPYMQITLEVGTPLGGPPPTYLFPKNYP